MPENYIAYKNYPYSDLFGSVVKQQIIKFFTEKPNKEFTVLNISRSLELNQSSISKPLDSLEQSGLLESRKDGKFRYYRMKGKYANHFADVYGHLKVVQAAALRDKQKEKQS